MMTSMKDSFKIRKPKSDNKGFTLVELIVVLVILAILAAILVPALLGYIDEAKEKQYVLDARNMMQAAQAEFISLYAKGEHRTDNKGAINYGITDGGNNDAYVQNSDFAKKVLSLSEISPYTVMIGAGSYEDYFKTDIHKAYTVYFIGIQFKQGEEFFWFDGNDFTYEFPFKDDAGNISQNKSKNNFMVNGKKIRVQLYFLKLKGNNTGKANWSTDIHPYCRNAKNS